MTPSAELGTDTIMSRLVQSQRQQEDLFPGGDRDHDMGFNESSYFHEASISEEEFKYEEELVVQPMVQLLLPARISEASSMRDTLSHLSVEELVNTAQSHGLMSNDGSIVMTDDGDSSTEFCRLDSGSVEHLEASHDVRSAGVVAPSYPLFGGEDHSIGRHRNPQQPGNEEPPTNTQPIAAPSTCRKQQKGAHPCTVTPCAKSFARRCDLTKHLKRHERPYGCTFAPCSKCFGSKDDWRRHENKQHYLLEFWACGAGNTPPCDCPPYNFREQFFEHLNKKHGMIDLENAEDDDIEECLAHRLFDVQFWCGFCCEVVQVREHGLKAAKERCNHMDRHFSGKNRAKISQWKAGAPGDPVFNITMLPEEEEDHGRKRSFAHGDGQQGRASKRRRGPGPEFWSCVSYIAVLLLLYS